MVLIIAEAGVNHNGSLELAKKLIEAAAEAGADIVKFQTFKANLSISKNAVKADYQIQNTGNPVESQLEMVRKLELSEAYHYELIEHCQKFNIRFLSTPFDNDSIDLLLRLNMPIFKIPSGEITNLPYLRRIGGLGKDVILSTGMSTLGEIEDALMVLEQAGTPRSRITVLQCNTEYPTPMEDVNLRAMQTIAQAFQVKVGYSDHTDGIEAPIAATALGATVIEKHFTLDRNMEGPDHKASLEPQDLKAMVAAIRNIEKALGSPLKQPSPSEQKNIAIARKSLHTAAALPAGHTLRPEDLISKRPGNGISPMLYDLVVGRQTTRAMDEDEMLQWTDMR